MTESRTVLTQIFKHKHNKDWSLLNFKHKGEDMIFTEKMNAHVILKKGSET